MISADTVDLVLKDVRDELVGLIPGDYFDRLRAFVVDGIPDPIELSLQGARLSYELGTLTGEVIEVPGVYAASVRLIQLINQRLHASGRPVDNERLMNELTIPTAFERLQHDDD